MVRLTQNSLCIEIPTDAPAETLTLLQQAILTVVDHHFLQLGAEEDRETGDAYHDLIGLLRALLLEEGQDRLVPQA